ncbi:sec1 family domain-containing protein 1 [Hyalella azteca]|uniref:Sec1 family domain-containing protein 1 n=1 Tax=Hyalella azteca TaxID=294128 RepID=A0A8B7PLH1_HYAAZ|nr:sec1 family domain-containing protein 1 [Hyalella azteca]XP_018027038.1 sec1 family domain-containing protein 1 [Hyalella azteca]XP_018027039.1 sec1 family domain-containing protein 1 [Hyalella azteca]XP_047740801.1 sec1 family domain-containing protein 1 [Hyalella azteca]
MVATLREKQLASLHNMIQLNSNSANSNETVFSVLIYDRHGQDIIAPLISVKQLRQLGVTLHLLLHSERGEVPDVPAIYFCQATEENLIRISQDLAAGLYTTYYLNFSTPISRHKMEDLAQAALLAGVQADIKKVYDQFINFISLEEDMFTLKHQGSEAISFYSLHRRDVQDADIELIIDAIVDGLFSVFVNLGQVPIIRSQRNNAAQMVAERLDRKLRDSLKDTRNTFFNAVPSQGFQAGHLNFHRPLLVLVDRTMDLATPLHHPWTYQALCHDLLALSLNRVSLQLTEQHARQGAKPKHGGSKEYDLGSDDAFWNTHKGSPFPNVAAAVEQELEDYKAAEGRIKGLKSDLPETADDAVDLLLADNTAKLTSAITSLPDLLRKKDNIDKHMSIAMGLLDHIKKRKLDVFFEAEEKIMARATLDKPLTDLLAEDGCGSASDKLRLFLIHYLCSSNTSHSNAPGGSGSNNSCSDADMTAMLEALQAAGADLKPVNYMKQWRNIMKLSSGASPEYGGGVTKTVSMFSKLLNHGSALVVEGVKNFVLKENKLPVTRIVDNLMELRSCEEDKSFCYHDPKLLRPQDANSASARARTPFQDCIVFVVGGGCYTEYANLRAYAGRKASAAPVSRRVVYGCSELLSPEGFLAQLSKLGAEIGS